MTLLYKYDTLMTWLYEHETLVKWLYKQDTLMMWLYEHESKYIIINYIMMPKYLIFREVFAFWASTKRTMTWQKLHILMCIQVEILQNLLDPGLIIRILLHVCCSFSWHQNKRVNEYIKCINTWYDKNPPHGLWAGSGIPIFRSPGL